MKKLFSTIKKYICPKVEKEIKNDIDRVSLRNIRAISLVVLVFELYGLIITVIEQIKGGDVAQTLLSVSFCPGTSLPHGLRCGMLNARPPSPGGRRLPKKNAGGS